jgi:hypothetical protein
MYLLDPAFQYKLPPREVRENQFHSGIDTDDLMQALLAAFMPHR